MAPTMTLYSYFRSSSSYRVRIALEHKGIKYDYKPVHLLQQGGEQFLPEFTRINPGQQVPTLVHNNSVIAQRMAILIYLEDLKPEPQLFSSDPAEKAKIIELCEIVNSRIQPLQNLKVLKEVVSRYGLNEDQKLEWAQFWINDGLKALEGVLDKTAGKFSFGDSVTAADCFLVPQVYNAQRFSVDMNSYPHISRVEKNCLELQAFQKAHPSSQPDAPSN